MNLLRQAIGLFLIALAWLNPLGFSEVVRIVLFILGFDMVSLFTKLLVFGIDYFVGLGIGWILILLVIVEVVTRFLTKRFLVNIIIKPLAVFAILYLSNLGLVIAIIVAGIDLLLNMTKKWV